MDGCRNKLINATLKCIKLIGIQEVLSRAEANNAARLIHLKRSYQSKRKDSVRAKEGIKGGAEYSRKSKAHIAKRQRGRIYKGSIAAHAGFSQDL